MNNNQSLGPSTKIKVISCKHGQYLTSEDDIATEIPFTIVANDVEIATLLCSPVHLEELTLGFLFTSGFIQSFQDVSHFSLNHMQWTATVTIPNTPDTTTLQKRLYTSGCGRGVLYTSINEITMRHPINNDMKISDTDIFSITQWLQKCSTLYRSTGGTHTVAMSLKGSRPTLFFDDIGRHNAVDKVIGRGLKDSLDFSQGIILSSGRTSSEILHKIKVAQIPISISRGAPTHQTVLKARDMGICLIGFARGKSFTIYSHEEKIIKNQ